MSRIAYVNGAYRPLSEAGVSVQDRGFQFADAAYEVWGMRGGRVLDGAGHVARLRRTLSEMRIAWSMSDAALRVVLHETARRNRMRDGYIYLQISRGVAPRDHVFPAKTTPTMVVTAKPLNTSTLDARARAGVAVVTQPDIRWARCDLKTVGLLPNVLARQAAKEQGAFEAWFVDSDGYVTEGTASNAWIVDAQGRLRTRELSNRILHGVTRAALIEIARERQIPVVEQAFTLEEAKTAREAFITSASNSAVPVISIDGVRIGDGKPSPTALRLRDAYFGA
ncbi:MAG TPA: D-amino-acid transaminase [Caulobacterales bacterium]|nr:D-amino-acid transaminase [Caulobacterales bacterium]